jgi:chromosome segregation ATPase
MSDTTQDNRPGFFRRFFGLLFRSLLVALLLLALGIGGLFLVNEAIHSSNNLRASMNAFESRVNLLRSDVDNLMTSEREQRQATAQLRTDTSSLQQEISTLNRDLNSQNQALAALETALTTAVADNETALANLQDGLLALQGDLNENNSSLDALGGELDGVRADFARLRQENEQLAGSIDDEMAAIAGQVDNALALVESNAAAMVQLERSVRLFRVWELITRTRLQLVEGNVGLARNDLNHALAVVEQMIVIAEIEEDAELAAALTAVQTRLNLALDNLASDPQLSARDLETAWDLLDDVLAERLLAGFVLPEPEADSEPEAEAEE